MTCVEIGSTASPSFCDVGFDARIDLRECADRAGNGAGRDLLASRFQSLPRAKKFGVGDGELEPERGRLGVDAVRAADGRGVSCVLGARFQRGEELVDIGEQKIGGANELHVEAGVEHVRGRHALMHETRFGADDFGKVREEGNDVVFGFALDLIDPRDVEFGVLALGPDLLRRRFRNHAEFGHGIGGIRLDLEPDAKARLRRPDRRHFGPAVAWDHP